MIHFDFVLTDEEATVLFDLINDEIADMHMNQLDSMLEKKTGEETWYKNHIVFLIQLKNKLKNRKV